MQEEGHQHVVAFLCQRHSLRQGRQLPVNAQGKLIREIRVMAEKYAGKITISVESSENQ